MLKLLQPNKRIVHLIGQLLYPAEVGIPAMIQEPEALRRTSLVCNVSRDNTNTLVIETQNTIYVLEKGE